MLLLNVSSPILEFTWPTSITQTTSKIVSTVSTTSKNPVLTSSASKIQDTEMYTKRGSTKRKSDNFMEEAVTAIKTLCQPDNKVSEPNSSVPDDSAHPLGLFIVARLREMMPEQRRQCEKEILKVMSQF